MIHCDRSTFRLGTQEKPTVGVLWALLTWMSLTWLPAIARNYSWLHGRFLPNSPLFSTRETTRCIVSSSGIPSTRHTWTNWTESSKGPWRWLSDGSTCHTGRELGLFSPEKRNLRASLIVYEYPMRRSKKMEPDFSLWSSDGRRGNGHKWKSKKNVLSLRFIEHRLPRQVLEFLPSETLKTWLDIILGHLLYLTLLWAEGLD